MKKILIVEDEQDMAKVIAKRLSAAGYETRVAFDALQGIAEAHKQPDAIVLDLLLPAGGGLSILQRLRESSNTRGIPVFVVTGNQDNEMKKKVLEAGVQGYFEKPFDFDQMLARISERIGK